MLDNVSKTKQDNKIKSIKLKKITKGKTIIIL